MMAIPEAKPYRSIESLARTYAAHTERAEAIQSQFERLLGRSLIRPERDCIQNYVLCCTFYRSKKFLAQLSIEANETSVAEKLSEMSAVVLDAQDYLVGQVAATYRAWGITRSAAEFSSLLEWEGALVSELREHAL